MVSTNPIGPKVDISSPGSQSATPIMNDENAPYVEGKPLPGYYVTSSRAAVFRDIAKDAFNQQWNPLNLQVAVDVRENLWRHLRSLRDEEAVQIANIAFPGANIENLTSEIKEALVDKWFWALKVITNHAAGAEQLAVSPLGLLLHEFKKDPSIQLAATTFLRDEAMHGELFRHFLDKNLGGMVIVSKAQVDDFNMFEHIFPLLTKEGTLFLALAIEVIGTSFFEFFAKNSPDPHLAKICKQIAEVDEKRHIMFCENLYNEFRDSKKRTHFGKAWELFRNKQLVRQIGKQIYKQQTNPNEPFMQAISSLGLNPKRLLTYTFKRLEEEFAKIGFVLDSSAIPTNLRKDYGLSLN